MARDDMIRPILRGVYADSAVPDSVELRCRAANLITERGAVICDRTAAWIHGVDTMAYWELERPIPIEVVVPAGAVRVRRSGLRAGERDLSPSDIQVAHGIRLTSVLRTALDLGCKLRRHHALASLDGLMAIGDLRRDELRAELPRFRRRRGVVQLRELIEITEPSAESPAESWLRLAIIDAGLPAPVVQFWVEENGRRIYRLDLAYPRLRICIEFDGEAFHSAEDDRRRDALRREWLKTHGWQVLVIRSRDLLPGHQERWLVDLRRLIAQAERSTFRHGRFDVPEPQSRPDAC